MLMMCAACVLQVEWDGPWAVVGIGFMYPCNPPLPRAGGGGSFGCPSPGGWGGSSCAWEDGGVWQATGCGSQHGSDSLALKVDKVMLG